MGSENFAIPKYWKVKLAKWGISKFGWRGGGGGARGIYLWVVFERQFRFQFRIVTNMSVPEYFLSREMLTILLTFYNEKLVFHFNPTASSSG
jgi:hypothetical protein